MKVAKMRPLPHPMIGAPTVMDHVVVRGWAPVYYPGEVNRCPSCGERQWRVGRVTAECAHCDLPLLIRSAGEERP